MKLILQSNVCREYTVEKDRVSFLSRVDGERDSSVRALSIETVTVKAAIPRHL